MKLQEKFLECFQKVSEAIGPVYRRLTAQQGVDGGSAYLDLEEHVLETLSLQFIETW